MIRHHGTLCNFEPPVFVSVQCGPAQMKNHFVRDHFEIENENERCEKGTQRKQIKQTNIRIR